MTGSPRTGLLRALAAVVDGPAALTPALVTSLDLPRAPSAAEHTDLLTFQLHPYASVHLGPEGMLGGVARDRVAGFLRALDVAPPAEPDHLVVLLHAYADLRDLAATGSDRAEHAAAVLLHEHLGSWVGRLLARAGELGADPLRRWAELLTEVLAAELAERGAPEVLPPALREAPALSEPEEVSAADWTAELLAPVRTGLVIARADLARAARELELGARVGERAFTLRALLDQDAAAVLGWLGAEARRQAEGLGPVERTGGVGVAGWWRLRLATTADRLAALAGVVRTEEAPA